VRDMTKLANDKVKDMLMKPMTRWGTWYSQ
jgi:hypothetical protein